jgi:ABC-type antimicrobial peptide transport system permease subunit
VALGGRREHIVGLVLGRGLRLITLGLGIGLIAALAGSRVLQSMLYGIAPTDPMTYAVVSIVLVAVTLAACWGPARRAASVDPAAALKAE